MRQNATPAAGPTPAQMKAIAALAGGATMTAAAAAAEVDRSTVDRWRDADAEFVAELNRMRRDQADATRAELRSLAAEAVRALLSAEVPPAIRLRAAMAALEVASGAGPEPAGPTDPEGVQREWEQREIMERLPSFGDP